MQISSKQLRIDTKAILKALENGEHIVITYHGTPKAEILPLKKPSPNRKKPVAFGMWQDHDEDPLQTVKNLRKPRYAR